MSRTRTMITQENKNDQNFQATVTWFFHNKSVWIKRKLFESYGYLVSILENDR